MEKTIKIYLHDGSFVTATMADYDAAVLADKINNDRLLMIAIGDVIINKNAVKLIAPVLEELE